MISGRLKPMKSTAAVWLPGMDSNSVNGFQESSGPLKPHQDFTELERNMAIEPTDVEKLLKLFVRASIKPAKTSGSASKSAA
jgi:hypothetical protein